MARSAPTKPVRKKKPKRPSAPRHANRYDTLTWCDARNDWGHDDDGLEIVGSSAPPESLDEVTCGECLRRIVAYGKMAARRLRAIT